MSFQHPVATSSVVGFPGALTDERIARPVVDLLIAMEDAPWAEPAICTLTGADRIVRVRVAVADHVALLTVEQTRMTVTALIAEQAFSGCVEVAGRLAYYADQADRAAPLTRTPIPHHGHMNGMAGLALLGAALFALAACGG